MLHALISQFAFMQGLHGDSVLVQGINTGSAVVHVKLLNRAWKGVSPDSVRLLVKENLMLKPYLPTYILPLSYVDYTLERRKQGKVEGEEESREGGRGGMEGRWKVRREEARVGGEGWKGRWRCMGEGEIMGRRVGKKLRNGKKCRHSER